VKRLGRVHGGNLWEWLWGRSPLIDIISLSTSLTIVCV
jgi:hypothetical protein